MRANPSLQVFLHPEKSFPGGQLKTVWYFSAGVTYVVDAPHFNWEYKTKVKQLQFGSTAGEPPHIEEEQVEVSRI